ncbi:MAG TPA: twin-arginine translocase TatA/TatE family subunit [Armatimonadota bacterium]|nr:twin-arginine translocase TatA/TatE family subunit [Armatimonadota bacterium]
MNLSPVEIGLILLVVFLLFGPKRLPELARSLGQSIREFKQSMNNVTNSLTDETPTAEKKTDVKSDQ